MSNSVNFYEFIGFVTFNIAVHELGLIIVYRFLLDRILVSMVPRATVHTLNLNNLKPLKKTLQNLKDLQIFLVFLGFYQLWIMTRSQRTFVHSFVRPSLSAVVNSRQKSPSYSLHNPRTSR